MNKASKTRQVKTYLWEKFQLGVAENKAYLFVSGYKPEVEEKQVESHIEVNTGVITKCYKMKTRK